MSRTTIGTAISTALLRRSTASFAVIALLLLQQTGQVRADVPPPDGPLTIFKNYPVTGDFVVGGIGLRGLGVPDPELDNQKFASGTISMSGVPQDADIVAAFLYWQSMETPDPLTPGQLLAANGFFRGNPIVGKSLGSDDVKACWGSGGGGGNGSSITVLRTYRASVLKYLPFRMQNGVPSGKRLVNDADLNPTSGPYAGLNLGLNTVKLSDSAGGGAQSPQSGNQANLLEGASLVVVYRRPDLPLRMVTIYDGAYTADQTHLGAFSQTIRGIDDALTSGADAKVTFLVGDGDTPFHETMTITGGATPVPSGSLLTIADPFQGAFGFSWDAPTPYSISDTVFTASSNGYKDRLVANVTPNGPSIDCLSYSGAIASAKVKDTDFDGLLDRWENIGLEDVATGQVLDLPDADPLVQDIFVQVDYMTTSGYTDPLGPVGAHSHVLTNDVIDNIKSIFANATPRRNPADPTQTISGPINVHIDIKHAIDEVPICNLDTPPLACPFPGFRGVVPWKTGLRQIQDRPVDSVYSDESEAECEAAGPACVRRFAEIRRKAYRYALLAHAMGVAQEDDPLTTTVDESKFPRSIAGVADGGNGGGDFMNTLGLWENNTGSKYMQTAVFVHELGHTIGLRHGGPPPTITAEAVVPSANCKPNYQSVMNYLYLVRGLTKPNGEAFVDYSKQVLENLDESGIAPDTLTEAFALQGIPPPPPNDLQMLYPNRWYVPRTSSFLDTHIGTTAATKHCDGTPRTTADTTPMVRIDGVYPLTVPNDWNGDGDTDDGAFPQDVNFNGETNDAVKDGTFTGFNDFSNMDLRQTASRRNASGLSIEIERGDLAQADPDWADPDWADPDWADPDWADPDWADPDWADPDWADPDWADPDWANPDWADPGNGGDIDKKQAEALGNAANFLSWTANMALKSIDLKWYPPHVGTPTRWQIWRAVGKITKNNKPTKIVDLPVNSPLFTYGTDGSVLYHDTSSKNNVNYSYFVTVQFGPLPSPQTGLQTSGPSNIVFPARR
jgi:hypothetical protein